MAQDAAAVAQSGAGVDPMVAVGRERRLHAQAYAQWLSLTRGRDMPALSEFSAVRSEGAAGNSVLVLLSGDGRAATIGFLGDALKAEAGVAGTQCDPWRMPADSLLGRLLKRLPDIAARRAPLAFEAEDRARGGVPIVYRGILLPLAGEDGTPAAVYGVMTWKEQAAATAPDIAAAVGSALAARPAPPAPSPWADRAARPAHAAPSLAQLIAGARTWAALAATERSGGATALNAALGTAYDVLLATRADSAGPSRPGQIVALVFGVGLTRWQRAAFIATLAHAARLGLGPGGLTRMLDRHAGGYRAIAMAERMARRAERAPVPAAGAPARHALTLSPLDAALLHPAARAGHAARVRAA